MSPSQNNQSYFLKSLEGFRVAQITQLFLRPYNYLLNPNLSSAPFRPFQPVGFEAQNTTARFSVTYVEPFYGHRTSNSKETFAQS